MHRRVPKEEYGKVKRPKHAQQYRNIRSVPVRDAVMILHSSIDLRDARTFHRTGIFPPSDTMIANQIYFAARRMAELYSLARF